MNLVVIKELGKLHSGSNSFPSCVSLHFLNLFLPCFLFSSWSPTTTFFLTNPFSPKPLSSFSLSTATTTPIPRFLFLWPFYCCVFWRAILLCIGPLQNRLLLGHGHLLNLIQVLIFSIVQSNHHLHNLLLCTVSRVCLPCLRPQRVMTFHTASFSPSVTFIGTPSS